MSLSTTECLIDLDVPPAYEMLYAPKKPQAISRNDVFLRVAAWLIDPSDPRLPAKPWTTPENSYGPFRGQPDISSAGILALYRRGECTSRTR